MAGALSALLGATGCVDDGVSIHVICPIVPELEDDACTYDAEGTDCLADGVANLASLDGYRLSLRVESGLTSRARDVPPQGEPNGLQVHGARIELRDQSGARLKFKSVTTNDMKVVDVPNPYDVVASGYIAPRGLGAVTLTAIDQLHLNQFIAGAPPTGAKLPQIVVSITLKGKTTGGTSVESGEYTWPVRLINLDEGDKRMCRTIEYCSASFGQDLFAEACRQ